MPLDGVVFHDYSDYKRGRLFRHLQKSKYNGVVQFRDCEGCVIVTLLFLLCKNLALY